MQECSGKLLTAFVCCQQLALISLVQSKRWLGGLNSSHWCISKAPKYKAGVPGLAGASPLGVSSASSCTGGAFKMGCSHGPLTLQDFESSTYNSGLSVPYTTPSSPLRWISRANFHTYIWFQIHLLNLVNPFWVFHMWGYPPVLLIKPRYLWYIL